MADDPSPVYKKTITEKLEELKPIFEKAKSGDFSENVKIPVNDEFTNLYEGVQNMLNFIRQKISALDVEIDARKRVQDELYRQKQDFMALANDSPDIIARFDHNLTHVYINPVIERITGIPPASFIGRTNKQLNIPEGQEQYWSENIAKVFQTGKEARIEFSMKAKDNQIRYFQARLVPELSQNGTVQYVLGVSHDITELKKRAEDLEKEQAKDQAILSNMGDGLIVTDNVGRITLMNQVAQDLLGWNIKDAQSRVLTEIVPMEDDKEHQIPAQSRPVALALTLNKKISATYYYRKKDGTRFPVAMTVTPFVISSGMLGAIEVFRDVTRMMELDQAKDQFISLVSHEMRTPITAVKGLISMSLKGDYGDIPDRLRQPLTNVYVSAERQIHLINDLLNITRLKAGRIKYTIGNFAIEKLTEEIVASLQMLAREKRIALTIEDGHETLVQADDIWVREILNNIIGNSVKFTTGGNVTVTYRIEKDQVKVVIADTGIGISKEDQEKLFGKFEQMTTPELGKAIGTGVGLYIARQVARKMGGDVLLEKSEPNLGSVFVLVLPRADTPRAQAAKVELEKNMELALNSKEESK